MQELTEAAPSAGPHAAFHAGQDCRAWEWLGAHRLHGKSGDIWHFCVWAPHAQRVSLVSEFNRWDREANPMTREEDGFWSVEIPAALFTVESDPPRYTYPDAAQKLLTYKFAVLAEDGQWHFRSDPCAFRMEQRPNTASIIWDTAGYDWKDGDWVKARKTWDAVSSPINIYEVHLGSWRREGGDHGRYLTYTEIADQLIPYALDMGYTHLEFLPVMEHPFDGSWGYQVTGYFSATSRFGTPQELMALIDRCHQAGLGVILDWVPAHFPKDENGLCKFDGSCLYEHPDPRRSEMPQWGTCLFDFGKPEVRSFLESSAFFWLENFHADGLRVDAVSAILYLDFCKGPGQWLPNEKGGRENLDGISFLQKLNTDVADAFPGVMMIAEESTAFPMVTKPAEVGGLGFTLKWNMGWMNDTLTYIAEDPIWRKWHHDRITFSLTYAFSEHYILPYSHDEVVYGKKSMLDKQPGDIWQKFAGLRALYGYQLSHPGKKLLFMGGEFGQFIEWKHDDPLDWFLLLYDMHPQLQACVRDMNRLYREIPALHDDSLEWEGFRWTQVEDRDNSVFGFIRSDRDGHSLVCVSNFTPVYHPVYRMGLPESGSLTEILNTDRNTYGGSDQHNAGTLHTDDIPMQSFPNSVEMCIPPLATVWFRYDKD